MLCAPSFDLIKALAEKVPAYMSPSILPQAVICKEFLDPLVCQKIKEYFNTTDEYSFHGCDALTKEAFPPLGEAFKEILEITRRVNDLWWEFALYEETAAWFQTYFAGNKYQLHKDSSIGQNRKLTAVVLLSNPSEYEGGTLRLVPYPDAYEVPKEQGTVCIFPSWIHHEVLPITSGKRQTLNVGFWGPQFK